ncbi:MAG: peptidylprolyl isomerase, partial [Gammaproteobacteria bacterium]|nr:peptidylprolyl isomerase [Gammaproteobacteria bacterium]
MTAARAGKYAVLLAGLTTAASAAASDVAPAAPPRTMADVIAATTPADWRPIDPENTLYLQLPQGRVVIELAPAFAPQHAANLKTLVREKYFDGLRIVRSQDNFVVQWGDGEGKRSLGSARKTLPPEFTVQLTPGLPFEPLPDRDGYA